MNNFNKMIEGNQLMVILIFIYFFYITLNTIIVKYTNFWIMQIFQKK